MMFFKKLLMPCGLCATVPAIKPTTTALQDNMASYNDDIEIKKLVRPSELPIYSFEDDYAKQVSCTDCSPSPLEQNIRKIRQSIQTVISEYQHFTNVISDTVDTGFEHSRSLLDYLREESNVMPRMGAIGIGGLTGLILGLRGRTFKRLVYSSTGALTMGAICYPKKAEEGFDMAKHYVSIGYNFIYGVKPSDKQQSEIAVLESSKLKVPTSFSEIVELITTTGSSMGTTVGNFTRGIYSSLSGSKEKDQ